MKRFKVVCCWIVFTLFLGVGLLVVADMSGDSLLENDLPRAPRQIPQISPQPQAPPDVSEISGNIDEEIRKLQEEIKGVQEGSEEYIRLQVDIEEWKKRKRDVQFLTPISPQAPPALQ